MAFNVYFLAPVLTGAYRSKPVTKSVVFKNPDR